MSSDAGSSDVDLTVADNGDLGLNAETAACDRWPLERVSGDHDEPDWYDARFVEDLEGDLAGVIVQEGTPVEAKTCRLEYEGRSGRWWIQRENHERLVEADGQYALSVYAATGEIRRQGLVAAETIDELIDSWWNAGDGGQRAEEFVQIPWSRVFDDVGGEEA